MTPGDQPQVPPRDLHATSDIRFVIVETTKLTEQVKQLVSAGSASHSDYKELRNWLIIGLSLIGGAGIGAVIWANGKFEDNAKQLSELSKSAAVMQVQASSTHDDIKDIKEAIVRKNEEKAAH